MNNPLVSVIIPAYNGATYLGEAIRSVLDQTYRHLELIVVDDASQDNTFEVVNQFHDKRLTGIFLDDNRGADHARMVGVQASSGDIVAFLDQDDFFHKEKLEAHVKYLRSHPTIGFSYNSYFNLNHSSTTIRDISKPPRAITLDELILGFPLPPSVWVLRREWATRDELWEEETFLHGSEIIFCGRLFMAGCKFGMVDRVLNYRRYESGRVFTALHDKCESELTCQNIVFDDPRCPPKTKNIRDIAAANIRLMWAYVALIQEETELGQQLILDSVKANPSLLKNKPNELTNFILIYSIDEETLNHEILLKRIRSQLPPEIDSHFDRQVAAQGYLLKGIRAVMWDRESQGNIYLDKAIKLNAKVDRLILETTVLQLMAYKSFYGKTKTKKLKNQLELCFERCNGKNGARLFRGFYSHYHAIENYKCKRYRQAINNALWALYFTPKRTVNRGLLSIIVKSSFRLLPMSTIQPN